MLISRGPRSGKEVQYWSPGGDYTHIQNLYDTTKLELMVEMTFNMYTSVSFLSLAVAGCVEMFASGYSSKEKEILKRPT